MSEQRHFTTRRGFVGAMGFGALGLYATWAAYGASPLPFTFAPAPAPGGSDPRAGHGAPVLQPAGHVDPAVGEAHGAASLSPSDFERRHGEFLKRFRQADGSIRPTATSPVVAGHDHAALTPKPASAMPGMSHDQPTTPADHAGHALPAAVSPDSHAAHGEPPATPPPHDDHASHGTPPVATAPAPTEHADHDTTASREPIEVYLAAGRFSFEPDDLRLEAGRAYRFHMMATDVAHGASIAFGRASRIVRLRPDTVTTLDLTFREAGKHLVYCTVYCGPGHDAMHAAITVA